MFDFEKLDIYQTAQKQTLDSMNYMREHQLDEHLAAQWKRAALMLLTNLTQGTGRVNPADKRHFYTHARGFVFECTTIINLLRDMGQMEEARHQEFYDRYETLSKGLLAMYRSFNKTGQQPYASRQENPGIHQ